VRILILDEPTAVLTDAEADRLLETIGRLAESGTTVVFVTHKLQEVKRYADAVTIMRGGKDRCHARSRHGDRGRADGIDSGPDSRTGRHASPDCRGTDPAQCRRAELCPPADGRIMLKDTSFFVRAGEIYGIAGGQRQMARLSLPKR